MFSLQTNKTPYQIQIWGPNLIYEATSRFVLGIQVQDRVQSPELDCVPEIARPPISNANFNQRPRPPANWFTDGATTHTPS